MLTESESNDRTRALCEWMDAHDRREPSLTSRDPVEVSLAKFLRGQRRGRMKAQQSVLFDEPDMECLRKLAVQEGCSVAAIIRKVIKSYLRSDLVNVDWRGTKCPTGKTLQESLQDEPAIIRKVIKRYLRSGSIGRAKTVQESLQDEPGGGK